MTPTGTLPFVLYRTVLCPCTAPFGKRVVERGCVANCPALVKIRAVNPVPPFPLLVWNHFIDSEPNGDEETLQAVGAEPIL